MSPIPPTSSTADRPCDDRPRAALPAGPRDEDAAEREFLAAIRDYQRRSGRMFPTWSEVLGVLRDLGYERASARPMKD
jgi:hypothetical protein